MAPNRAAASAGLRRDPPGERDALRGRVGACHFPRQGGHRGPDPTWASSARP